jgi:methionine-rich copper-binding protein CopC
MNSSAKHSRRRRPALIATAIACLALAVPAAASAHVEIVAKSPSGTAKTTVKRATVTLSGPIRSGMLTVLGPDGSKASKGTGGRDPHNFSMVSVGLKPNLAPGRYTARVTWVSADGHRQSASFGFRLTR